MERYELSRLNSASFERLVRALCFRFFGPSGKVFSSGPDGGRDFAFEGKVPGYENKRWRGYLVLQAKFKERALGGAKDIEWLKDQLDLELLKLKNLPKSDRPNYYIIATNISLSGADSKRARIKRGGYTKVEDDLKKWKIELGLKDFDIWGHDKIVDLLAGTPDVRQTYLAWITPGDVLARAFAALGPAAPGFDDQIRRALKNSLRRDQYARLKDAGSVSDEDIRTSQVFVDLPIQTELLAEEGLMLDDEDESERVVASLIERARNRLSPDTFSSTPELQLPDANKIVVLGGPGQGKSTAGLFLVQLLRAALLVDDPKTKQDATVKKLVPEILERANQQGISTDIPRRYPIHVVLPKYADTISKSKSADREAPSLLTFIAEILSRAADQDVDRTGLRDWLRTYPWLVVLDGLDEVPPSGERLDVLDAIQAFLTEIVEASADVLLIVTTRPQGYNKDLSETHWEHWRLADLPSERSLAYARALSIARYPTDQERRDYIDAQLEKATRQPATSRLMISPLQVTIMHMIVDTGGGVPAARWTLFSEYFEILKKREKAKGGETQKAIERNLTYLGPIHHRVGLALQASSERAGGAGATMDHGRFEALLREYLKSVGYEGDVLDQRVSELMQVALQRLVLLSTREEGSISFDVRSLQEFMAAASLTSDGPDLLEARLHHIAGLAHWRHVFLIAASRCFADDGFHHCRATVVNIPRQLESAGADMLAKSGAKLALEMFVDGIGVDHPIFRKQLAAHALDLLALGPEVFEERLPLVWEDITSEIVLQRIKDSLSSIDSPAALAAWKMVFRVPSHFRQLVVGQNFEGWPENDTLACRVLGEARIPLPSGLLERASTLLLKSDLRIVFSTLHSLNRNSPPTRSEHSHAPTDSSVLIYLLADFVGGRNRGAISCRMVDVDEGEVFAISVVPTHGNQLLRAVLLEEDRIDPRGWHPLIEAARFADSPTILTLATAIRRLSQSDAFNSAISLRTSMPWPLGGLLESAKSPDDALSLADEVEQGNFGGPIDWISAEKRWALAGITSDDLLVGRSGRWFGKGIAVVGGPGVFHFESLYDVSSGRPTIRSADLFAIAKQMTRPMFACELLYAAQVACWNTGRNSGAISVDDAPQILETFEQLEFSDFYVRTICMFDVRVWKDPVLADRIAKLIIRSGLRSLNLWAQPSSAVLDAIVEAYNRAPNRGLLPLIAFLILVSSPRRAKLPDIPLQGSLIPNENDPKMVRLAIRLLRLTMKLDEDIEGLCAEVCSGQDASKQVDSVVRWLSTTALPLSIRLKLASALLGNLQGQSDAKLRPIRVTG